MWRPEKLVSWELMKFSEGKCKDLQLRRNNPLHRLSVNWLESSFAQHRWEHTWNAWWSSRAPQVKQRATKTSESLQHLMDGERLRDLGLLSLRKRRLRRIKCQKGKVKNTARSFLRESRDRTRGTNRNTRHLNQGRQQGQGYKTTASSPTKTKESFYLEDSLTLNQVAQRWCSFPPWRHVKPGWISSQATCYSGPC